MLTKHDLVNSVKAYDTHLDADMLGRAYVFALRAHGDQRRASGEPYFYHPLEVAQILIHWRLDGATVATALLHDTVEDTTATLEDITKQFGPEVAFLVSGVTKLSKIELQSDKTKQSENFRKLVLAMSQDLRVLLVKLADRLHNMRTLGHITSIDKRERIARETMDIYAPLAERIGMHEMRTELEDLAFFHLNPDSYQMIISQLESGRAWGEDLVPRIFDELKEVLHKGGLHATLSGREKTPHSIWRKMQMKNVEFEQLSDIMAFRVIVETVSECYQALGVIHSTYAVVPGRFKDYISTPKSNMYRSLHTTVIGPENQRIEIQIRTREMHDIAEMGVAAHWKYKDTDLTQENPDKRAVIEGAQYQWVRSILDILEHATGPDEFLEHTKLEMFSDQVFCFTPEGDLINLPKGATPVDFAYAVHSAIGDKCVGAKVNGRLVPLRIPLQNGDQVDIITSEGHTPLPAWERFVVTGKARAAIRRFMHEQERKEYYELGRALVDKAFSRLGLVVSEQMLSQFANVLKYDSVENFLIQVGKGTHLPKELTLLYTRDPVLYGVTPAVEKKLPVKRPRRALNALIPVRLQKVLSRRKQAKTDMPLPIHGLIPGMAIHYAGCCHPLPGEKIVGIVTTGKGVTVHVRECDALTAFENDPDRWIDLTWKDMPFTEEQGHIGRLRVMLVNQPGSLGALSTVLGKQAANIANLKITHRSTQFFELFVDVEVKNIEHLNTVIASLRASKAVHDVSRH